jgi:hypothetical protein
LAITYSSSSDDLFRLIPDHFDLERDFLAAGFAADLAPAAFNF